MEESKTKPIPLTESELLQLQTGLFDVIEKTDPKWTQSPNTANILYLNEPMIATIGMELTILKLFQSRKFPFHIVWSYGSKNQMVC